jgi:MFS family permease
MDLSEDAAGGKTPAVAGGVRWLLAARSARSVGQGVLVVDFTLYLHALGWRAAAIGALLGAAMGCAIVATLLVGPLSDRLGRKWFLVGYEVVSLLVAVAALLSSRAWVLVPAAILGGFGRGQNGAAGPFGPVEHAWLAAHVAPRARGRLFSLNTALGAFGMALGALLAALPHLLRTVLPGALAFRPLFLIVAAASVVALFCLLQLKDETPAAPRNDAEAPDALAASAALRRRENGLLRRLVLANFLNGAGIGLVGPLIAYWFFLRYGAGPAALAPMMGGAFVLVGISALGTGWISERLGVVRTVVGLRFIGLLLLAALPFMPGFGWAAALYVLRAACNMGTAGARQALNVSLVRAERRGMAASVANVSLQVPRMIGPVVAGVLLGGGWLVLPFLLATGFQAAYLLVYQRSFFAHDPSRG